MAGAHDHDDHSGHDHGSSFDTENSTALAGSNESDFIACLSTGFEPYNTSLHIAAIFILVGVSLLGSLSPVIASAIRKRRLSKLSEPHSPNKPFWVRLGLLFGAGTILANGFIHLFVESAHYLTSSCVKSTFARDYEGFAGVFAILGIVFMQFIQYMVISYYERVYNALSGRGADTTKDLEQLGHSHCHASHHPALNELVKPATDEDSGITLMDTNKHKKRVAVVLLELGIATHSVIVGIALGVSTGSEFNTLLIALCFHQLFEGITLGSTVVDADFSSNLVSFLLAGVYGVTTPLGVVIGLAINSTYNPNSPESLLSQGILMALSAGILIYTALVELINPEMTESRSFRSMSKWKQAIQFLFFYLGIVGMGLLDPCTGRLEDYDLPMHISSIFILVTASLLGSVSPVLYSIYKRRQEILSLKSRHVSLHHRSKPATLNAFWVKMGILFGAGAILATAYIHMFPAATLYLTSPCLPPIFNQTYTAFSGLFAVLAMLLMQCIQYTVTSYYEKKCQEKRPKRRFLTSPVCASFADLGVESDQDIYPELMNAMPVEPIPESRMNSIPPEPVAEGIRKPPSRRATWSVLGEHVKFCQEPESIQEEEVCIAPSTLPYPPPCSDEPPVENSNETLAHITPRPSIRLNKARSGDMFSEYSSIRIRKKYKKRIAVALLEIGIAIHSLIIGITLGVSSGHEFIALLIALCIHQCFEGLALGTTIVEAEFENDTKSLLLTLIYIITTPIGIALGIGIHQVYQPKSPEALITQGTFESISAGILTYTAIVEFITPGVTNSRPFRQQSAWRKAVQFLAMYLGVALMAFIGRFL